MPDQLLRPYAFEFFVNGLAAATLAGALCGLVGVFVVLKGMSYLGHGLSHAVFGGFAASVVTGVNPLLGAGVWGLAAALAIGRVTRTRPLGADAAIGVVTVVSFALGVALLDLGAARGPSFDAALFGSIVGVGPADVAAIGLVLVAALVVVVLRYRALLFIAFDPDVADASGVSRARHEALLLVVLTVSILSVLTVIGVTLVAATLVVPAAAARLLTHSFSRMLVLSTLCGAVAGFVGMNASYQLDVPSGTTIVLVDGLLFAGAMVLHSAGRAPARPLPAATLAGVVPQR